LQSRGVRIGLVVAAAAVAVALFVVLSDGDDEESRPATGAATATEAEDGGPGGVDGKPKRGASEPKVPTIEVKGGQPVGGVRELSFESGDEARFRVESDVAEHVHIHGYDVIRDIAPGRPVTFEFPADIEGVFEVELEDSHVQIAELEVSPG
jgi:hypothetical protein